MSTVAGPLLDVERDTFFQEGAYVGSIFNFITEEEVEKFNRLIPLIQQHTVENRNSLKCRYDYEVTEEEKAQGFIHSIPISEYEARDKFVRENNRFIQQIFFEFGIGDPRPEGLTNEDIALLMEIKMRILSFFYPELSVKTPPMPMFMLYEDGHFISKHKDGGRQNNPDRACVIILYLTPEAEYNDGGGELIVTTNSGKVLETKPVFGSFSMLDFTQSDVEHSVNVIKNGFKRLSSIYFFDEDR